MNEDLIDPEWDEREFVISETGQAVIDEAKALWVNGVGLDEIAVYMNLDSVELTTLIALENLSNHLREVNNASE